MIDLRQKRRLPAIFLTAVLLVVNAAFLQADPLPAKNAEHPLVELLKRAHCMEDLAFQKALAANRDNINEIRSADGKGLLHIAAERAYANETLLLLLAGADPNLRDAAGRTPLHYAVTDSRYERAMVRDLLILKGAKPGVQDNEGDTPLIRAIAGEGSPAVVEMLLWVGEPANVSGAVPGRQPLELAVRRGDKKTVELLEAALLANQQGKATGRDLKLLPQYLRPSLTGDLASLEQMIGTGANLNQQDENGRLALVQAAGRSKPEVVMYLLMLGAAPNLVDNQGNTPLSATNWILGSSSDYCRLILIGAGASFDHELKNGRSILTDAVSREQEHAMQWAIWMGIDPTKPAKVGTPMHVASEEGKARSIARLRMNGVKEAEFQSADPAWQFLVAIRRGKIDEIDRLLAAGVNIDLPLENSDNAMIHAIHSRRIDVAKHLLARGSNPNFQNPKSGGTPLHASTGWLYWEIEQFRKQLLEAGADPNLPDYNGMTPMMAACRAGDLNPKVIQMLDHGGDLTLRDKNGLTALDYAKKSGAPDVPNFLEQLGTPERQQMLSSGASLLIGTWKFNGDSRVEYLPENRMRIFHGDKSSEEGTWNIADDRITVTSDERHGSKTQTYLLVDYAQQKYTVLLLDGWGITTYDRVD